VVEKSWRQQFIIKGTLLREEFIHSATGLGIQDFKASTGWVDGFK
jgi:hypothetical protein